MGMRPAVILTHDELVMRNPFSTDRIPLREVVVLDPGYSGLSVMTAGKGAYVAWAVQKSNIAYWAGRHTRADHVAEEIRKAALNVGASVLPANPMKRRYSRGFRPRHARKDDSRDVPPPGAMGLVSGLIRWAVERPVGVGA